MKVKKIVSGKAVHKVGKAGVGKKSGNLLATPVKNAFAACKK